MTTEIQIENAKALGIRLRQDLDRLKEGVDVNITQLIKLIDQLIEENTLDNPVDAWAVIDAFLNEAKLEDRDKVPLSEASVNNETYFHISDIKAKIYKEVSKTLAERNDIFEREYNKITKTNAFIDFIIQINNLNYVDLQRNKQYKEEVIRFFKDKDLTIDEFRYVINQLIKKNILPRLCSDAEPFETLKSIYQEKLLHKIFEKYSILNLIYIPEEKKPNETHAIEQIGYLINDYNNKKDQYNVAQLNPNTRFNFKHPNLQAYKDEIRLSIDSLKEAELKGFFKNKSISNLLETFINNSNPNVNAQALSVKDKKHYIKLVFYKEISNEVGTHVAQAINTLLNTSFVGLDNTNKNEFLLHLNNFIRSLKIKDLKGFAEVLTQKQIIYYQVSKQDTSQIKNDLYSLLANKVNEKFFTSRQQIFCWLQNKYSSHSREIAVIRQIKTTSELTDFITEKFKRGDLSVKELVQIYKRLPSTSVNRSEDPKSIIINFAKANIWNEKLHYNFFKKNAPTGILNLRRLEGKNELDFDDILNAINYTSVKSKIYNLTGIRDSMTKEFYELIIEINQLRQENTNHDACILDLLTVFKSKYKLKLENQEDLIHRIFNNPPT